MRCLRPYLVSLLLLTLVGLTQVGCGGGGSKPAPIVAPSITTQPAGVAVNQGQPANLSVVATGTAPLSYQWKKDGTSLSGSTGSTFGIASTQPGDAGSYTVVVSNGAGTATSNAATLSVVVPPSITTQPTSLTLNQGQTASFSVVATGTTPLSYQWKKDGTNLTGAIAAAYSIASALPGDAGSYTVTVSNGAGSVISNTVTLSVAPLPIIREFKATPMGSPGIPIGGSGILTWDVTGGATLAIDQGIGSLGSASGTRNVSPSATTTYTLTATNTAGPVTAKTTLVVDTTPFQITSFSATPTTVPFGGSTALNWAYGGLPLSLTLDGAPVTGYSAIVSPVRRQSYVLAGMNGAGSDSRSVKVAARGLDLLAGNADGPGTVDGVGAAARFNGPSGVAMDAAGNVYVADVWNHIVRKITPGGAVSTLAGTAGVSGSVDGTGASARFYAPMGVAVDAAGNVLVADTYNSTIRKITSGGVVSTLAGTAGAAGSADGVGAAARFTAPFGVAVDAVGNVYVTDTRNHTIRKITSGGVVSTLAGWPGVSGSTDGTGSAARFSTPTGVAADVAGNLFVADALNYTIRKITPGGAVSTLAGTAGVSGSADGVGASAKFGEPDGVAVDAAGNVFVGDYDSCMIRKITPGGAVSTVAGNGGWGSSDGTGPAAMFMHPRGVALDAAGNVVVADSGNHTIRRITTGGVVSTLAGKAGIWGRDDGLGAAALFFGPFGVTVDAAGNTFVADFANNTIRRISSAGEVSTFAGAAGLSGSADGTGATARFNTPSGVAVDVTGNVFVADYRNHTIRKITPSGLVSTMAGTVGVSGSADGVGVAAQFFNPISVSVDVAGNVFVVDSNNNTIRKITSGGVVSTLAGTAGLSGSADGTGTAARFKFPNSLAADGAGNVFVADAYNSTIRKISPGGVVSTLAGMAGVSGSADGTGAAARFNDPTGVAVDSIGNVFVADSGNHTIRKITPGGVVSTVAGQAGQATFQPGPLPGLLTGLQGIAVTPDGDLIVTCNNGIVQITAP